MRLLLAVVLSLFSGLAPAAIMLTADLTNDQENPPAVPTLDGTSTPRPASFGTATFVLDDAMSQLAMSVTVFNIDFGRAPAPGTPVILPPDPNPAPQTPDILNDDLLVAHIHRGPVGVNGPVIFGFIGTPFSDNNPNDVVITPFDSGVGGTVTARWNAGEGNNTTLAAELSNLLAGDTYINFHTVQFGGGEVRGQIVQVSSVSEPGALALLGLAFGALALCRRSSFPSLRTTAATRARARPRTTG
jgi:hypothetical protein